MQHNSIWSLYSNCCFVTKTRRECADSLALDIWLRDTKHDIPGISNFFQIFQLQQNSMMTWVESTQMNSNPYKPKPLVHYIFSLLIAFLEGNHPWMHWWWFYWGSDMEQKLFLHNSAWFISTKFRALWLIWGLHLGISNLYNFVLHKINEKYGLLSCM